jgi:hypothetical protein
MSRRRGSCSTRGVITEPGDTTEAGTRVGLLDDGAGIVGDAPAQRVSCLVLPFLHFVLDARFGRPVEALHSVNDHRCGALSGPGGLPAEHRESLNETFGTQRPTFRSGVHTMAAGTLHRGRGRCALILATACGFVFAGPHAVAEEIFPDDGQQADAFGWVVSISGDRLIVGAPGHDDDSDDNDGAAYIFERQSDGSWLQAAKLLATPMGNDDYFGGSVAIFGEYAIASTSALFGNDSYAVIFERDTDGVWTSVAQLLPHPDDNDFPAAIAISGTMAFVGEPSPTPVPPPPLPWESIGRVYKYERDPDGSWQESGWFSGSQGQDNDDFGASISIAGDLMAIGAPGTADAVYVFEQDPPGVWTESAVFATDDPEAQKFGASVAISEDGLLVVGDTGFGSGAGAAYILERQPDGTWSQAARVTDNEPEIGDNFGHSVATMGDLVVVGSLWADGGDEEAGVLTVFQRQPDGSWIEADSLRIRTRETTSVFRRRCSSTARSLSVHTAVAQRRTSRTITRERCRSSTWRTASPAALRTLRVQPATSRTASSTYSTCLR